LVFGWPPDPANRHYTTSDGSSKFLGMAVGLGPLAKEESIGVFIRDAGEADVGTEDEDERLAREAAAEVGAAGP
jgi:hypothetical protein